MKRRKTFSLGLAAVVALAAAPFASANLPDRPDLSVMIDSFREAQQELVQERRALAESLRDLTAEERRQAIEEYQAQNADRIALHRALSEQIREQMKDARPNRPVAESIPETLPGRPEVAPDVQSLINNFRDARDGLIEERRARLAELKDATDEERAAALAELREQNAELVEQQKAMARQIRDEVQAGREDRRNNN